MINFQAIRVIYKYEMLRAWHAVTASETSRCGIPTDHVWRVATDGGAMRPWDPTLARRQQRIMAQLRSGVSPLLGAWKKVFFGGDPKCPRCGALEDVAHVFNCPIAKRARLDAFGDDSPKRSVLLREQRKVLGYCKNLGMFDSPENGSA